MDRNNLPTSFTFDLVDGSSPLLIGLDVREYTDTFNLPEEKCIKIKRPYDSSPRFFGTYISPEGMSSNRDKRLRIAISMQSHTNLRSLMSNLHLKSKRSPLLFSKQIHRFTHTRPLEVKTICEQAGILTSNLGEAIDKVDEACEVCVQSGRPIPSKKVSLTHVNEAFNEEIQLDFPYCDIRGTQKALLVITDAGTGYTEASIVLAKDMDTIVEKLEVLWICMHGAPRSLSADDEYHRKKLTDFLRSHDIQFKPRPARRHNKVGIVERKNGTLKEIIQRLDKDISTMSSDAIVARATFLSNMFSGSRLMSSFELARGYSPSILGLPRTDVSQELLDAHKEQVATRALQRLLRSRSHESPIPDMFRPNDLVWVFYKTTKKNEKVGWVKAKVVKAEKHHLLARRSQRGPPMRVAYEDVRLAPQGPLAQELMSCSVEHELGYEGPTDGGVNTTEEAEQHLSTPSLMVSEKKPKGPEDDIGQYTQTIQHQSNYNATPMLSDKGRILDEIHDVIGSQQVSGGKLAFAPPWIIEQAFEKEHQNNWSDAYEQVREKDLPRNANIITSHVVYKIKTDEQGERDLKARIVPHGNRDVEKDSIRKDSATAQLGVIRLLLSIVTFLGFRLGFADIKGAYLQSGPIQRDIYVRPPKEWQGARGMLWRVLWRLTKLPYGIVEAGRQWQKTIERWMMSEGGLETVFGLSQLFVQRDKDGKIKLLVAKVTDDFLIGGLRPDVTSFIENMKTRFVVGKSVIDSTFFFDGCEIAQDEYGNIKMTMIRYMERLKPITLSRQRRRQHHEPASDTEKRQYRSLAGTLLYLGNGVMPQASYVTSVLQQQISALKVRHLVDANNMLGEILQLDPTLTFLKPHNVNNALISSFSDASHPRDRDYGQSGVLSGIRIQCDNYEAHDIFHMVDWSSHRQKRVSYSSYGAEILACASADDRGYYLKEALNSLFPRHRTRHELSVDSHALKDTITTLHEGSEYRLRHTVQRIRNSFESGELDVLRWIPGTENVADALTKRNIKLYRKLNDMCAGGRLNVNLKLGYTVDSDTWK